MVSKLSQFILRLTNWRWGLVFTALLAVFNLLVMPGMSAELVRLSGGAGALDLEFFYTPAQAFERIERYGEPGRAAYRRGEILLDGMYPIVYGLWFAIAISACARRAFPPDSPWQRLHLLPILTLLLDYGENLGIITLLTVYPVQPAGLAWVTAGFTLLKWTGVAASVGALVIVAIIWLRNWLTQRRKVR